MSCWIGFGTLGPYVYVMPIGGAAADDDEDDDDGTSLNSCRGIIGCCGTSSGARICMLPDAFTFVC